MARFDKVDPKDGSFRVKLGFAVVAADVGKVIPIDITGAGLAARAAANSVACRGVICPTAPTPQGDPIDCMTDGEIVDVNLVNTDVTGAVAGADIKAGAAGTVDAAGTGKSIGWMVENWRLIVRLGRGT
jgi:hypothetical protein